jgi:hypothetical protein
VYLDKQGASALHPLPSPSRNLDKASQHMARLSTHLTLSFATLKPGQNFPQLNTTNVTQVVFALVQHTLEAQVSCLYASFNLMVGKELFNESQLHIILHLFYTQHCVGKLEGVGPQQMKQGKGNTVK